VLNKMVLLFLCCAISLFPVRNAQAQDPAVLLPELPVAMEPERMQDLILFSAAQNKPQSVRTDESREQSKSGSQTAADSEREQHQEEMRKKVSVYGPPRRAQVIVWLSNGKKLTGTIAEISSDSFLLRVKKNKSVAVSYTEVTRGPVLRTTTTSEDLGQGAAMVLVLAMYVTARVLAYDSTHR
jgi:sRNA-binding regulator protein Hfq